MTSCVHHSRNEIRYFYLFPVSLLPAFFSSNFLQDTRNLWCNEDVLNYVYECIPSYQLGVFLYVYKPYGLDRTTIYINFSSSFPYSTIYFPVLKTKNYFRLPLSLRSKHTPKLWLIFREHLVFFIVFAAIGCNMVCFQSQFKLILNFQLHYPCSFFFLFSTVQLDTFSSAVEWVPVPQTIHLVTRNSSNRLFFIRPPLSFSLSLFSFSFFFLYVFFLLYLLAQHKHSIISIL